jgi:hypothetical protein
LKIARVILGVYAVLCVISLFLIPVSVYGWFGAEKDLVGAVFAVISAMPWSPPIGQLGTSSGSVWLNTGLMAGGMLLNGVIILILGRLFTRPRKNA